MFMRAILPADLAHRVSREASKDLEHYLPQPVEDATIIKDLVSLRGFIESHALDFYHTRPVKVKVDRVRAHLQKRIMRACSDDETTAVACGLVEPESRKTSIRAVIARVMLADIDFCGDPNFTLLSLISRDTTSLMSAFKSADWPPEMQGAYQSALSKWRILTAFLSSAPTGKLQYIVSNDMTECLTDSVDSYLEPFIEDQYHEGSGREDRKKNLAWIINRTARIGTLLFAQPSTWDFSWDIQLMDTTDSERQERGQASKTKTPTREIVVFPAIRKTNSLDGQTLQKAVLKEAAEVVSSSILLQSSDPDPHSNSRGSRRRKEQRRAPTQPKAETTSDHGK